jgi:hypothetical protein
MGDGALSGRAGQTEKIGTLLIVLSPLPIVLGVAMPVLLDAIWHVAPRGPAQRLMLFVSLGASVIQSVAGVWLVRALPRHENRRLLVFAATVVAALPALIVLSYLAVNTMFDLTTRIGNVLRGQPW